MAIYNDLQFHGIGIAQGNTNLQGITLTTGNTSFQGITINAGNFFNESIIVNDIEGNTIQGATVEIVSTQTHPNNYEGNITGITNSEGLIKLQVLQQQGQQLQYQQLGIKLLKYL